MAKRIFVGLAALLIVIGVSARFSTIPTRDVTQKRMDHAVAEPATPPSVTPSPSPDVAPEITPTPPTPVEQENYQDAVMSRRYLDAFDECTDRAVERGPDYAFALCGHLVGEANAYSKRAGLGYAPTEKDVMIAIQRKFAERAASMPPPPDRTRSPFAY